MSDPLEPKRPRSPHTAGGWAFGPLARIYDWQLALERAALRRALALARPGRADLVLDLGTGTGAMLKLLAWGPSPPHRAVGVDLSRAMLAQVGPLPAGWTLAQADITELPFAAGSADLVTCAYVLHLLPDVARRAAVAEIARVMRPGGRAVVITVAEARGGAVGRLAGPAQRLACRRMGRRSAICALDPGAELRAAGLIPRAAWRTTRGYPSLCVLARPIQ